MLPSTFSVDMAREAIRQIGIYTSFLGLTECHSYTDSTTVTPVSSILIDPTLK